ncbi:MAG: Gfo/Idh/MocA family oxidoreductase, partial [Burkholderiales bacterium]|nr:Gfo/Idh/MocA family oxidoreductase [Anaerolineae bacterium]
MSNLRFAVIGAGFWSNYQLAGWNELESIAGVECVAICDRMRPKAEALAQKFGIPAVYDDAETMLKSERLDFVDVITSPETHEQFVRMAAAHNLAVICQKPMALTLASAEGMVAACHQAGVPFFVHENFRWQAPMRYVKQVLDELQIGRPFRARFDMVSGFPVFVNQPSLRELEQFIITDVGSHTLDLVRFFFGEASSLYCHTQKVHSDIKGEDIASIILRMHSGATVQINMGFAENYLEHEAFPQTLMFVE